MFRVLLTEARRGIAPLAVVVVAAITIAVLLNEFEHWVGRWTELNGWIRVVMIVIGPVVVALAAWFGGRDRRRRTEELLASTPRPPLHRILLGWGSTTLSAAIGLALAWALAAILVVRLATYGGGPSWVTLAVAFVGVGTCAAVGFAIGRVVRWRAVGTVIGAIAGLLTYVVFGIVSYQDSGSRWLIPSADQLAGGRHLVAWASVAQVVFFVAVGFAALVLVAPGRRAWALVPIAIAVGVAYPLVRSDADDVVVDDTAALAPVCVGDAPQVCIEHQLAFALPDFEPVAREAMSTWSDISIAPSRALGIGSGAEVMEPDGVEVWIEPFLRWDGTLTPHGEYGRDLLMEIRSTPVPSLNPEMCGLSDHDAAMADLTWEQQDALFGTATMIIGGDPHNREYGVDDNGNPIEAPPFTDPLWDRVSTWSRSEQVAWFEEYTSATAGCRFDELARLARDTGS